MKRGGCREADVHRCWRQSLGAVVQRRQVQEVGGGTSSSMAGSSAAAAARAQAGCESGLHSARISFNLHTSCGSGRNQSCAPSAAAASLLHQARCFRASTACRNAKVSGTITSGSSSARRRSSASCPVLHSSSRDSAPTGTPSTCASTASHSCSLVSSRVTDAGLGLRRFLALYMYHSHVAAASISPAVPTPAVVPSAGESAARSQASATFPPDNREPYETLLLCARGTTAIWLAS